MMEWTRINTQVMISSNISHSGIRVGILLGLQRVPFWRETRNPTESIGQSSFWPREIICQVPSCNNADGITVMQSCTDTLFVRVTIGTKSWTMRWCMGNTVRIQCQLSLVTGRRYVSRYCFARLQGPLTRRVPLFREVPWYHDREGAKDVCFNDLTQRFAQSDEVGEQVCYCESQPYV